MGLLLPSLSLYLWALPCRAVVVQRAGLVLPLPLVWVRVEVAVVGVGDPHLPEMPPARARLASPQGLWHRQRLGHLLRWGYPPSGIPARGMSSCSGRPKTLRPLGRSFHGSLGLMGQGTPGAFATGRRWLRLTSLASGWQRSSPSHPRLLPSPRRSWPGTGQHRVLSLLPWSLPAVASQSSEIWPSPC